MNDGSIRIIIGAAMDRSVETIFGQIEKRAQKAGQNINKAFSQGFGGGNTGSGTGKGFDAAAAAARKAERDIEREIANQVKATKAGQREMLREHARSRQAAVRLDREASREIIRNFKDITRERKNELRQQERDAEKSARAASQIQSRFGSRMGMYAIRNMAPNAYSGVGMARRVGTDLLRGAGVDTSLAGSVSRAVELESGSTYLANQERIATGSTRGSKTWNRMSRDIGDKYSTDAGGVQGMISAFTAKTGQFSGAAGIADQVASLSVASGANLRDMGNAAGYVYNQLQRLPDAGQRTIEVMRGIVGQTAVGAVDMPDFAVQLGRIAANASKFEGSVADNIREQSAIAQLSIESGGASSPADAARAVAAFDNTFGKHARIAAFAKHGVDLFTDDKQDTLKTPMRIIEESFRSTHGNIPALSEMFADTLGRKPVTALGHAYKEASAGKTGKEAEDAGIAAIRASFDKYMRANMSKEVEAQNIKDYQASTAAKAQKFQNALDHIVVTMSDSVFPALEKLAPDALKAASALANITAWGAENPKSAIAAALGLSIAQAGIQATVRMGFEKLLSGDVMQVVPSLGKLGLAMGGLTAVVVLAALAFERINEDIAEREKSQRDRSDADANAGVMEGEIGARARKGKGTEEDARNLEAINANLQERIRRAQSLRDGSHGGDYADTTGGGEFGIGGAGSYDPFEASIFDSKETTATRQDLHMLDNMNRHLEENKRALDMIRNGVQRVEITNMPAGFGDSAVDPSGRGSDPNKPRADWVRR